MKLLHLGRLGLFEPVITEPVIGEWLRLCRAGLGHGRSMAVYGEAELDAFCEALEPLLEPGLLARVRIGRAESPLYPIRQESGLIMIQLPQGVAGRATQMLDVATLGIGDIGDFHVVEAALRHECAFICTANTRDFPDGLRIANRVEAIRPERLYRKLTE